mmetsp:Transcript_26061/g.54091  ORF Transcript_26061/g.54091 Transcript_26061/m.54091 type:complete len:577 (+) Transcript_26061:165-1895(+)
MPSWQRTLPPSRASQWVPGALTCPSRQPRERQPAEVGISPACWGISKADLGFFRQEVWKLWAEGCIADNPEAPNPFHDDEEVGPNIYQVNELYIKPTTLRAGGMSWALMRHPNGLKCDVFASHAWSEGIFEFVWKVSVNWPRNTHGLYCCFLANPQNGDIASLLGNDPANSPFARALAVCSHVIIVPNRRVSVYSRLWCVFEAHLAMEHGLPIAMPTRPKAWSVIFRMLPYLITSSLVCLLFWYLESHLLINPSRPWTPCNLQRLLVLLLVPAALRARRLYIGCLCFTLGWQLAHWITHDSACLGMIADPKTRARGTDVLFDNCEALCITFTSVEFVITELVAEALKSEGSQLEIDTVQKADCSDQRDRDAIRRIISGREPAIDAMITLLKQVGRYDTAVETNLKRGMNPIRVKDGVMHMRGVGGCSHWMAGLIRTVAALLNGSPAVLAPAVLALLCAMPMVVMCCAATFCFTVWWGDDATYFVDTLLWSGLLCRFSQEILWYAVYNQHLSTVFSRKHNPMEALGYFMVLVGVGAVAVPHCIKFYRRPLRSCILELPEEAEQSSSTDTEDFSHSTS